MSLRQRPTSRDICMGKKQGQDMDQDKLDDTPKTSPSKPRFEPSGSLAIVTCALCLSGLLFYAFRAPIPWLAPWLAPKTLSGTYALCSHEVDKVYTVDENNSQTQCIVVHNGYIHDTGALRQSAFVLPSCAA